MRKMAWIAAAFVALGCVSTALFTPGCASRTTQPAYFYMKSRGTSRPFLHPPLVPAPGVFPLRREELWIIQKPTDVSETAGDKFTPTSGVLTATPPDGGQPVPLPLKHTDVDATIGGYISTVEVTQQFHNPYDGKIEAVYVFPLPHDAAVNEFIMTIGERRIRGIIRERDQAQKIYKEALAAGLVASLLIQDRPNIFTQRVGNIEPGKQIDINIKYFHTLTYADGWYEFVFPMVVGPRYNPPGTYDGVGAVGRGVPGRSGQATEVQYLKPNERSGHDISLAVTINAGVEIEDLACRSHVISVRRPTLTRAEVKLNPSDSIPNKDFVLRFKVAGDAPKAALLTHRDQRGGFFTLMLYPPEDLSNLPRGPMEMVYVIDCSGSMSGEPLRLAKAAVNRALDHMRPEDTFQLIRFSVNASKIGRKPLSASSKNIRKARRYLRSLGAGGGTHMIEGIKAALDFKHDTRRMRFVVFLTDGYIGNEADILGEIRDGLGESHIFSFGIGSSPNRYLLAEMAKVGRGVAAHVGLNDSAADVMDLFFRRVSHPALKDIEIDWGGMEVADVFPPEAPDLFVGRPVILTGRFDGRADGEIRISGSVGNERRDIIVALTSDGRSGDGEAGAFTMTEAGHDHPDSNEALPFVWARQKIADLYSRAVTDDEIELPRVIRETALEYGLVSAYTSFVAVDSLSRTAGEHGTTVAVPVPVPAGVRYEMTVDQEP